jgi:hypothetical protein
MPTLRNALSTPRPLSRDRRGYSRNFLLWRSEAIVLGDCVTLPLQVRINSVDPKRSDDPPFFSIW